MSRPFEYQTDHPNMRLVWRSTLLVGGILAALLVTELALSTMPVTMGLYRTQRHDQWPMYGYGPRQRYTYSLTWQMLFPQKGVTNNYGQTAPFDYWPGSKPVVVVGDSFIESQMNPYSDTLQGELGRLLDGRVPVYGFGFAGNSLAEYLAVARQTRDEFAPRAMVFLIVDNDVRESWNNRVGHRYFEVSREGIREGYQPLDQVTTAQRIRGLIGDSSFYRYVKSNLGFGIDRVINKHRKSSPRPETEQSGLEENSARAIDYFLARLPEATGLPPEHLVLVFDTDRGRIYDPAQPPRKSVDSPAVQRYFRERARASGMVVIDTASVFSDHYARHGRKFDFSPVDPHWNGLGHRVVAAEVLRAMPAASRGR